MTLFDMSQTGGEHDPDLGEGSAESSGEYGSHAQYMERITAEVRARSEEVTEAVRSAFAAVIRLEELEVIDFQSMSVLDLGHAIEQHPLVLKALLAVCNIGGRAIERDLDLKNIDTYGKHLTNQHAYAIAGYIKPFLPDSLPIAALIHIDRFWFIDKEVRANKGQWEKLTTQALVRFSGLAFKKTKFKVGNQTFELDSAYASEHNILYGIDVKRIEARRDIHKRSDEIVNKASKFKHVFPAAKFGVMIYYPFQAEHGNIRDRLDTPLIDSVQFAGESKQSVNQAVRLLLGKFEIEVKEEM
jgi:hypothetical protein